MPPVFLGVINCHDSGASLIIGNRLVSAVSEERFSRVKNTRCFPVESIKWVLQNSNIRINEVDYICCGSWKGLDEKFKEQFEIDNRSRIKHNPSNEQIITDKIRVSSESDKFAKNEIGVTAPSVGRS